MRMVVGEDFDGAMSLCERLAVHKKANNPNDPEVEILNKAAGILERETPAHKHGWAAHKSDCRCEACYLQHNY